MMATQNQAINNPPQHKEFEDLTDAERTLVLEKGADYMPLLEEPQVSSEVQQPEKKGKTPKDRQAQLVQEGLRERAEAREFAKKEREEAAAWRKEKEEWEKTRQSSQNTADVKPTEEHDSTKHFGLRPEPKRPDILKIASFAKDGVVDEKAWDEALQNREKDLEKYYKDKSKWDEEKSKNDVRLKALTERWDGIKASCERLYGQDFSKKLFDPQYKPVISDKVWAYLEELQSTEIEAMLLHYFDENKEDAKRISSLPLKAMTKEIEKLEDEAAEELRSMNDDKADLDKDTSAGVTRAVETAKKPLAKLTKAGKPPVEAGGGSSTPEDDGSSDAAWKRKDLSSEARGELYRTRKNAEEAIMRRKRKSN